MTRRVTRRRIIQGVGTIGAAGLIGVQPATAQDRRPLNRHIVGTDAGRADVARREADEVYRVLDFGDIGMAVSGWYPDNAIKRLKQNPNVRYVEQEGVMTAIDHTTDQDDGDPSQEQVLPWGIDRVDADVAHHNGETGAGSSIAVIDTGINPDHETLAVAGGEAFVNCEGDCVEDWDDDHGHGTHVAGTAGALDNGIGVVGVSTATDLYAVKVLDGDGGGTFSDVAAGIRWTADSGHDVANMSLGGGDSETVADACEYAHSEGVLLVAAAGNDGSFGPFSTVNYPAAYDEVIAVSAVNEDDNIASFSSVGNEVELAAPGVDVLSSLPGDEYDEWNGTSMAAPHVAGAGAQLMEHDYSNEDARARLNETAEDVGLTSREQGSGLVDVAAALGIEPDDEDEEEEEPDEEESIAVETRDATEVEASSAKLNGELTELEGFDEGVVYFEWGESGEGLPNTTGSQPLDSPGGFSEDLSNLESETEYEFRAVAEANGETDTGVTLAFTTEREADDEDDPDDDDGTAPVIDRFDLEDRSNPRWARVRVDWEVSDDDGNLDTVESVLTLDGTEIDSESTSVSGSNADDEHNLRNRDGHDETYGVTLTVTDTAGNETSETKSIALGNSNGARSSTGSNG